ncbi:MAG: hypothetical protein R2705_00630 [Ilumatobacteraceae bacterium]
MLACPARGGRPPARTRPRPTSTNGGAVLTGNWPEERTIPHEPVIELLAEAVIEAQQPIEEVTA